MVAVAFLLADRAALTLQMVLIYILVGAVSVILHDFAHRYFANRYGHDTDIQFWGLGTVIMFLTAWLYGNAFAQSYRNIVERDEDAEEKARESGNRDGRRTCYQYRPDAGLPVHGTVRRGLGNRPAALGFPSTSLPRSTA